MMSKKMIAFGIAVDISLGIIGGMIGSFLYNSLF